MEAGVERQRMEVGRKLVRNESHFEGEEEGGPSNGYGLPFLETSLLLLFIWVQEAMPKNATLRRRLLVCDHLY